MLAIPKDISVHLIIRTAGALVNLALEFVAQPVLERLTGETVMAQDCEQSRRLAECLCEDVHLNCLSQ